MINGYRIHDADAHVNAAPEMWEDLPREFAARRPRPALIHDGADLGNFTAGWLTDGHITSADIAERQKEKILFDNPIRLFGAV